MNGDNKQQPITNGEPFFVQPEKYGHSEAAWQAVITAGWISGATLVLLIAFFWLLANLGVEIPLKWSALAVFFFSLAAFLIAGFVTWMKALPAWMGIIEKVTNRDLDGNGIIGNVTKPGNNDPLWIMHNHNDKKSMWGKKDAIPHREYLPALAEGLLEKGMEFSQPAWEGKIPQKKFYPIQRAFIEQNLASPPKGRNGAELTEEGIETLQGILAQYRKEATQKKPPLPYFNQE